MTYRQGNDKIYEENEEFREVLDGSVNVDDMNDIEEPVVLDAIYIFDYILKDFYYDYMIPYYEMINPDINQISRTVIDKYEEVMDGKPFLINPDYARVKAPFMLPINPDGVDPHDPQPGDKVDRPF